MWAALLLTLLAHSACAQKAGKARDEMHLAMPIQHCTNASGCQYENTTSVLDSNWRWTHKVGCTNSSKCNCYLGNVWVNATCSSVEDCTDHCALDGEDIKGYKEKYGVTTDGQGMMNLTFVTHYVVEGANGTNVGQRMYLLEDENNYKMFNLLNKELSIVIDNSKMPCGLNAAFYFVEMQKDGGTSEYKDNEAGAKYGTGYCDAQCPHDMKWIAGKANMVGWNGSKSDPNVGFGKMGTCCAELDIWEANKISTPMTVHSCNISGYHPCNSPHECGDNNGKSPGDPGDRFKGVCDKNGCDFNPYREGAHDFYGPGPQFTLDSTKPMRVVTQFITDDGTDTGNLVEMKRFYVQDGKTIQNPTPSYATQPGQYTSITNDMCEVQMNNFTDHYDWFNEKGNLTGMGKAMGRGMTMVLSLWDDHEVGMIWLDATDPYPIPPGKYGAPRGTCNQTSGNYTFVEKFHGDSYVLFSDIRYGEIGSTGGPSGPPPPPPCPGGTLAKCIAQCGHTDKELAELGAMPGLVEGGAPVSVGVDAHGVAGAPTVFPGEHYGNPMGRHGWEK
jgi:cellulose 1,4-beta-cellobiosidase